VPPANNNHTITTTTTTTITIPYLGEQSICTSFFQMLCFLVLDTNGERRLNSASIFNPTTTCLSGSRYHALPQPQPTHSAAQYLDRWRENAPMLERLPSSMTCRCCPICALQMHSHQDGICVQHPRLGGFGPLPLPGNPRAQAKCNVTHASYCKCSDGRSASRGALGAIGVWCAGSSQRVVQPVSCDWRRPAWGSFTWRGCELAQRRKHITFGHIILSPFGHGTRMIRAARLHGCTAARAAVAHQLSIPPI
jgi:hypothetical protein